MLNGLFVVSMNKQKTAPGIYEAALYPFVMKMKYSCYVYGRTRFKVLVNE